MTMDNRNLGAMKKNLEEEMFSQQSLSLPNTDFTTRLLASRKGNQLYQLQEILGQDPRFRMDEKFFGDFNFDKLRRSSKAFKLLSPEEGGTAQLPGDEFEKEVIADKNRTLKVLSTVIDDVVVKKRRVFVPVKRFDPNMASKAVTSAHSLTQKIKESFQPSKEEAEAIKRKVRSRIVKQNMARALPRSAPAITINRDALKEVSAFKDFNLNLLANH